MPITTHDTTSPPLSQPGAGGLADSAERIDHALADFLQSMVGLFSEPPALREVFELTRRFVLTGGKRPRLLLCWCGWCGAGGDSQDPNIFTAAASLELFHAFALIHDDIMDASDTRRARPVLHRARCGTRWAPKSLPVSTSTCLTTPPAAHSTVLCGPSHRDW